MIVWNARRVGDDEYVLILSKGDELHREVKTTPMTYARVKEQAKDEADRMDEILDLRIEWLNGSVSTVFVPPE